jgi:hypothetical protein
MATTASDSYDTGEPFQVNPVESEGQRISLRSVPP